MRTRKVLIYVGLAMVIGGGCSEIKPEEGTSIPVEHSVALAIEGYGHIDSARAFFFRRSSSRDSLFDIQTIYDITSVPRRFKFSLPAGYYTMVILGNIDPKYILKKAPYDRDSVWLYYPGGVQPPAVYYGMAYLNIGVDTSSLSGMMLMTSAVQLTVKNVPEQVHRIAVSLHNTGVGIQLNGIALHEQTNPPLVLAIEQVQAGNSYTLTFSCFPTVWQDSLSVLEVRCYNRSGDINYSGRSGSFPAYYGRKTNVSCSFEMLTSRSIPKEKCRREEADGAYNLKWDYDEAAF